MAWAGAVGDQTKVRRMGKEVGRGGRCKVVKQAGHRTPALQPLPQCGGTEERLHAPLERRLPALRCSVFSGLCSSLFSVDFSLLQRQIQPLPDHAWLSSDDKPGLVVGRCVFWSGQDLVIVGGSIPGAHRHYLKVRALGRAGQSRADLVLCDCG